jgi:hypothetical protein
MHSRLNTVIAVLGLSAVAIIAVFAARGCSVPSDQALRDRFLANRVDFERLVAMSNEDSHLTRIAPDFTWLDDDVSWPRRNVGISEQRWNDYRELFRGVGAPEGIIRRTNPTQIIFPIMTEGLVPTSLAKGLVYSEAPLSPVLDSLDKRPPRELWNGPDRSHVLVYKPIENHWYIYYEQR